MSASGIHPHSEVAFIVGHYKSGSTWLCNLLSLHPDVRGLSETHVFRYAHESKSLADATKAVFSYVPWAEGGRRGLVRRRLADLARMLRLRRPNPATDRPNTVLDMSFCQRRKLRACLADASGPTDYCRRFYEFQLDAFRPRRYLIDKTPTNIFEMERIEAAFPGSKYIAIYRDGRDVAVSEKYFRASEGHGPTRLRDSIDKWRRAMEAQREAVAKHPLYALRYEDLLDDPDHEITGLLKFLGLSNGPAIVERMKDRSSFEYITGRKRGEEHYGSFYRKGIAGDWRNHFSRADMELFAERAGDLLVELGYERSADPATWGPVDSVPCGCGARPTSAVLVRSQFKRAMKPAIRVENLSKYYRLGERQQGYRTLRESIAEAVKAPFRRFTTHHSPLTTPKSSDFWALKDVSFEVQPGEVVGIIGRNGAGKSTLLKILSRITEPTSGRIELRGRVGSLLEVGTGFHPELTGRENIYMNGSILGMTRREIARKFDEIVDFAGIEEFLDTPVKRYSSGMYVRLAFSVAAHLEPEILIIDEVLAVGDAEFQRKCLGKMQDVAKWGRTVLFVSHNMAAVESLCRHAIRIHNGRVVDQGATAGVVNEYRQAAFAGLHANNETAFDRTRYFKGAQLLDDEGAPTSFLPLGGEFHLRIVLDPPAVLRKPVIGIGIDAITGERMLSVHTPASRCDVGIIQGLTEVTCHISRFPLAPGEYIIKLALTELRQELEAVEAVVPFTVDNAEAFGEGRGFHRGVCVVPSRWTVSEHSV